MASRFKGNSPIMNAPHKTKVLILTGLIYVFFLSVFVFADKSATLWNSHIVSACLAVVFTLLSSMQLLIILRVSSLSTKTNRMIRELQALRTSSNDFQLEDLSTSEEILINIEALRSALNALNIQKLDS